MQGAGHRRARTTPKGIAVPRWRESVEAPGLSPSTHQPVPCRPTARLIDN